MNDKLYVHQLFDTTSSTFSYLLIDPETGEAAIIDPVLENYKRDLSLINELDLQLKYCIETHVHADHVTGSSLIREDLGSKIITPIGANTDCNIEIQDHEQIYLGKKFIEALSTPGHTDHHMSYYGSGYILTGDALFIRACGRTDFQNGDPAQLYDSVTKILFTLPGETIILPGHDYRGFTRSTIAEESKYNPRFKNKTKDQFIELMTHLNLALPQKMIQAYPNNLRCGNYLPIIGKLYPYFQDARNILQLGSVSGFDCIYMALYFPDAMCQIATRKNNLPTINTFIASEKPKNVRTPIDIDYSKENWPLETNFDAAISFGIFYDLSENEINSLFKNLYKHLKINGNYCAYEPLKTNQHFASDSIEVLENILKKQNPHSKIWDIEEINKIAMKNNFKLVTQDALYGGYFMLTWEKH